METKKTNRLRCIITGRQLIATQDYYKRKVEKAGGEQQLHDTYVCREAKNLLKQGVSVERIREILEADMSLVVKELDDKLLETVMAEVQSTRVRRINNIVSTSKTLSTRTDPQVKQYIKHITNNE
jgi:hypothetical protein